MKASPDRKPQSLIMYIDIDAFFPSVEQAKFPNLRGRPVAVGSGVVASSSYEARCYGISAGTAITQALKLCPDLVVLKGHQHTYSSIAQHVFSHCRRLTPLVDAYLDEAFCDLTGTHTDRSDLYRLGRNLQAAIRCETGLGVTIGFASNRMIAKMVAKDAKPEGVAVVAAGGEEEFMHDRPLTDVPGIGKRTAQILQQINVRYVRDLKRFPLRYLERILGKKGYLIHERLQGRDPYVPSLIPRSISRETSFGRDTTDLDEILGVLYYLTERACRSARGLGVIPRHVQVKIRYGDGTSGTSRARLSDACVLDVKIFELAKSLFMRMYVRCRVHLVGVALTGLCPARDVQQILYDASAPQRLASLYQTLDLIRSRFGHTSVIVGRSITLMNRLERDSYGYILRTPSLTK